MKAQQAQALEPLEQQIAHVVAEHPEYHHLLTSDNTADRDWLPEQGMSNPFLHMSMHLALRDQLSGNRPPGITAVGQRYLARYGEAHRAEHEMMECLAEALWQAQRAQSLPDEAAYLRCLGARLGEI